MLHTFEEFQNLMRSISSRMLQQRKEREKNKPPQPPNELEEALKEFDEDTEIDFAEFLAKQREELNSFERNWILVHKRDIEETDNYQAVRNVEMRENLHNKQIRLQHQYNKAKNRLIQKQKAAIKDYYNKRNFIKNLLIDQIAQSAAVSSDVLAGKYRERSGSRIAPSYRRNNIHTSHHRQTTSISNEVDNYMSQNLEVIGETNTSRSRQSKSITSPRIKSTTDRGFFLPSKTSFYSGDIVIGRFGQKKQKKAQKETNLLDEKSLNKVLAKKDSSIRRYQNTEKFASHFENDINVPLVSSSSSFISSSPSLENISRMTAPLKPQASILIPLNEMLQFGTTNTTLDDEQRADQEISDFLERTTSAVQKTPSSISIMALLGMQNINDIPNPSPQLKGKVLKTIKSRPNMKDTKMPPPSSMPMGIQDILGYNAYPDEPKLQAAPISEANEEIKDMLLAKDKMLFPKVDEEMNSSSSKTRGERSRHKRKDDSSSYLSSTESESNKKSNAENDSESISKSNASNAEPETEIPAAEKSKSENETEEKKETNCQGSKSEMTLLHAVSRAVLESLSGTKGFKLSSKENSTKSMVKFDENQSSSYIEQMPSTADKDMSCTSDDYRSESYESGHSHKHRHRHVHKHVHRSLSRTQSQANYEDDDELKQSPSHNRRFSISTVKSHNKEHNKNKEENNLLNILADSNHDTITKQNKSDHESSKPKEHESSHSKEHESSHSEEHESSHNKDHKSSHSEEHKSSHSKEHKSSHSKDHESSKSKEHENSSNEETKKSNKEEPKLENLLFGSLAQAIHNFMPDEEKKEPETPVRQSPIKKERNNESSPSRRTRKRVSSRSNSPGSTSRSGFDTPRSSPPASKIDSPPKYKDKIEIDNMIKQVEEEEDSETDTATFTDLDKDEYEYEYEYVDEEEEEEEEEVSDEEETHIEHVKDDEMIELEEEEEEEEIPELEVNPFGKEIKEDSSEGYNDSSDSILASVSSDGVQISE